MKMEQENGRDGIIAWHGTNRTKFASFEVAVAGPYNVGLHFGTRTLQAERVRWK